MIDIVRLRNTGEGMPGIKWTIIRNQDLRSSILIED